MQVTDLWFSGPVPNPFHPVGWIIDPRDQTVTVPANAVPGREPIVLQVGDDISSWWHVERHNPRHADALLALNRGRRPEDLVRLDVLLAVGRIVRRYRVTDDEFFLLVADASASMNAVLSDPMERGTPLELQAWIEMEIEGRVNELIEMRSPDEPEPTLREVWAD